MAQRIVDLDKVAPEQLGVRIEGTVYDLPGDIPIPTYLEIERLNEALGDPDAEEGIEDLYDRVVELFAEHNELPLDGETGKPVLPIGPRRLGALVVQLYAGEIEEDEPDRPTKPRGGTRSTKSKKPTKSRSSRS